MVFMVFETKSVLIPNWAFLSSTPLEVVTFALLLYVSTSLVLKIKVLEESPPKIIISFSFNWKAATGNYLMKSGFVTSR